MDLPTFWFIIVAWLLAGFFFLEGFDYGVGMLLPFLSKEEAQRRMIISSIGGVWDGNEVWMVSAGAVLFASFPSWYATLFSSLYIVFTLILCGLILRGIGIKFRNLREDHRWRAVWDWLICTGSFTAAFFWGVVVGDLLQGLPITDQQVFAGGIRDIFTPFSLTAALAVVSLFLLHGAVYLNIKLSGDVLGKLKRLLPIIFLVALLMAAVFLLLGYLRLGMLCSPAELILAGLAVAALIACGISILRKADLTAFWASGTVILLIVSLVFTFLYPRVLISTLDPRWTLTVQNASSSPYSLKVMSVVAIFFIPTTLLYQAWTYWVLRKRVEHSDRY
ncbi:MAG: cytochrome d ubiquinol oxidase subunit II [Candidatus Omnitrophica bacterium]|nr:cytochrome d ubiquinol oxidase subunit II [Candidatus Omnitrophota bacterium]